MFLFHTHEWIKIGEYYEPSPIEKIKDTVSKASFSEDEFFYSTTTLVFQCKKCTKLRYDVVSGKRIEESK